MASAAFLLASFSGEARLAARLVYACAGRACTKVCSLLGPKRNQTLTAFVLLTTALVASRALMSSVRIEGECPPLTPRAADRISGGPASLLAMVKQAEGTTDWKGVSKQRLHSCLQWAPSHGVATPPADVRAQLECHAALLAFNHTQETGGAADLIHRPDPQRRNSKTSLSQGGGGEAAADAWSLHARVQAMLMESRRARHMCEQLRGKLQQLRRADAALKDPLAVITSVAAVSGFERLARDTASDLQTVTKVLRERVATRDWGAKDLLHEASPLRIQFAQCMLSTMRDVRILVHALPSENSAVRRLHSCRPDLLVAVEELALAEGAEATDSGAVFSHGLLLSEAAVAPLDAPLFGIRGHSLELVAHPAGSKIPESIVQSEERLKLGFESSLGQDRAEQASLRSIQLCHHAKFLSEMGSDEAAETRYRVAGELAAEYGRQQLAAHALAELSYFLLRRAQQEKALAAAGEALVHAHDPLASYVQVSLRLALGELRTEELARDAAKQLAELQGKLGLEELETHRAKLAESFRVWENPSETKTIRSCFATVDAAHVVICLASRFLYA